MSAAKHVGRKKHHAEPVRPKLYYPGQVWTVESLTAAWVAARCMGLERLVFEAVLPPAELIRCIQALRPVPTRVWLIQKNCLTWTNHGLDGRAISMKSSCGIEAVAAKLRWKSWDLSSMLPAPAWLHSLVTLTAQP